MKENWMGTLQTEVHEYLLALAELRAIGGGMNWSDNDSLKKKYG